MDNLMDRLIFTSVLVWTVALSLLLPAAASATEPSLDDAEWDALLAPAAPTPPARPLGLASPTPPRVPLRLAPLVVPIDFAGRALEDLVVEGNKAVANDRVTLSERYDDVFVAGEKVELKGYVGDHLFAAAGEVLVSGHVAKDVFAAAGLVMITGTVGGDLYVSAGELIVAEGAQIGGRLLGGVGKITLDGQVGRDLQAGAGELVINGTVAGDVDAEVGALTLGPTARVGGQLSYVSSAVAQIAEGAQIGGGLEFEQSEPKVTDEHSGDGAGTFFAVWGTLASMVLGALMLWGVGPLLSRATDGARDETAHRLGLGFAVALVVPAVAGALAMFVVPIPVSLLLLVLLWIGCWTGRVVAATALGDLLLRKAGQESPNPYLALAAGLGVLLVVTSIPILGFLAGTAATLVGLGAIFATARDLRRSPA